MTTPAATEQWTVRRVLEWTRGHFDKQAIDSPRLTAELLLSHVLNVTRVKLYVDLERPLQKDELAKYKALIQRRLAHEPTQYLMGTREFYGRPFAVDARVLIPRPETELLVEAVLRQLPKEAPSRVLDVCTGSGCIAVSIAAERPHASVWATDLMANALEVAKANAETLGVGTRVTFFEGDLLAAVPAGPTFDVVVSNPPYVKSGEIATLQHEVRHEPRTALDGGTDGLDFVKRLAVDALPRVKPGGWLALEIGEDQGPATAALLTQAGWSDVRVDLDLERRDRLVFGRAPKG